MKWIAENHDVAQLAQRMKASDRIGIDTEADSLHSYFDKVCLIQVTAGGEDYIVDPLAKVDLSPLGAVLADRSVTKILHGADYDIRILQRDFGFVMANLIDTMICAQLLGYESIGLAALLKKHFDIDVDKSHQRADWAIRPLPKEMAQYASMDTRYLVDLAAIMEKELRAAGRWEWAIEEFERLEAIRYREAENDGEGFRRLKGISKLDRRSLGILARLHAWRDRLARQADKPPFRIMGNDVLIEIATARPADRVVLGRIRGMSGFQMARFADDILAMIAETMALPEAQLPEKGETKPWKRDAPTERKIEKLKKSRDAIAADLKIDASVLAPKHILTAIALASPRSVTDLSQIPAMRNWQKALLGQSFIDALTD